MKAEQIMTSPVATVLPTMRVQDAARLLIAGAIGSAPVVDDAGTLIGIVTEADLLALETDVDPRSHMQRDAESRTSSRSTVGDVMSREVVALPPGTSAAQLARTMIQQGVRRIPIVANDKVIGIVSRRDLLRALVRTDAAIRADVEALLAEQPETYGTWEIEVHDGVVVLAGPTDNLRRRLVHIVAHTVPGVLGVRIRECTDWSDRPDPGPVGYTRAG